jgi:hypothetical protein
MFGLEVGRVTLLMGYLVFVKDKASTRIQGNWSRKEDGT